MPACKACGEWFAKTRDDRVLCNKCEMALGRLAGYAVVVTRCKDCRYRGLICCPAIHETIGNGLVDYSVDNGYCWCGKPKED